MRARPRQEPLCRCDTGQNFIRGGKDAKIFVFDYAYDNRTAAMRNHGGNADRGRQT